MTNKEFDKYIDTIKKTAETMSSRCELEKQLLIATLENLRKIHNSQTKQELGLDSLVEKLQALNHTIETGLDKVESIKKQNNKEER